MVATPPHREQTPAGRDVFRGAPERHLTRPWHRRMLAHARGAAALDAPACSFAYGAAAVVLVATAALRGRIVVRAAHDRDPAPTGGAASSGSTTDSDRTIDYSPLTPGVVGATELALAIAGGLWGVAAAACTLLAARDTVDTRAALRALWATGLVLAAATAGAVVVLASDLE
jgi:hypothetical protein